MAETKLLLKKELRLNEIASINLGVAFRDRIEPDPAGTIAVVQMRDLTDCQRVEFRDAAQIRDQGFTEAHLLSRDDLVFRSRGLNNTAAIVQDVTPGTILAAPLFRIRVSSADVRPAYLQWFINHPIAQAYFASHARGTSVRMVPKECLAGLPVILPLLEIQDKIVEFSSLADREEQILSRLANLKRNYYQRLMEVSVLNKRRNKYDIKD